MARRRVDDQAGWFVQHQQRLVLKQDIQRDRFRLQLQRLRAGNGKCNAIPRPDLVTRLGRLVIDADAAFLNEPLNHRPRQGRIAVGQEQINTLRRFPGRDHHFGLNVRPGTRRSHRVTRPRYRRWLSSLSPGEAQVRSGRLHRLPYSFSATTCSSES